MLFNSFIFLLAFLPLTLGLYYALAGNRNARLNLLCVTSVAFYAWWDVRLVPLLVGSVIANWLLVHAFSRSHSKWLLVAGIALNLVLISIFKYADFFAENLLALFGQTHRSFDIVLPLGISFFTFQQISYLADVTGGNKRRYAFRDYFLYVTFFPQLIAGPIVRHDEILDQFPRDPRREGLWERIGQGTFLLIIGLAKKVLLADPIAAISDPIFTAIQAGGTVSAVEGWVATAGFTLQVYFDFSGYSDMAIGLGLLCGFRLPDNFNVPYRATSIAIFWRRWHMTLSRFMRDYLYIPMGGSRRGRLRQATALAVTMLLGGLWHGASWPKVLFGACHAVYFVVLVLWSRVGFKLPAVLCWAVTMFVFMLSLAIFRSESYGAIGPLLAGMFGANGLGTAVPGALTVYGIAALVSIVGPTSQHVAETMRPRRLVAIALALALTYILIRIGSKPYVEFIYFQF